MKTLDLSGMLVYYPVIYKDEKGDILPVIETGIITRSELGRHDTAEEGTGGGIHIHYFVRIQNGQEIEEYASGNSLDDINDLFWGNFFTTPEKAINGARCWDGEPLHINFKQKVKNLPKIPAWTMISDTVKVEKIDTEGETLL